MEEACQILKREDASLPQDTFDKSKRNMREMIMEHARQYRLYTIQQREKLKHLSVNVWLNLSVKSSSQCELPISVWATNLSVNYPPQCEHTSVWTFSMLNSSLHHILEKTIVSGPRRYELVRKQRSADDLRQWPSCRLLPKKWNKPAYVCQLLGANWPTDQTRGNNQWEVEEVPWRRPTRTLGYEGTYYEHINC